MRFLGCGTLGVCEDLKFDEGHGKDAVEAGLEAAMRDRGVAHAAREVGVVHAQGAVQCGRKHAPGVRKVPERRDTPHQRWYMERDTHTHAATEKRERSESVRG